MRQRVLQILLIPLALFALAQCNEKGESHKAKFTVMPEKPIVILADTTVNGQDVKGPWFRFKLRMRNDSSQTITIVALQLKITSVVDPVASPFTKAWDAGSFNINTDTLTCLFTYFGEWLPNTENEFMLLPDPGTCPFTPIFVVSGLPTDDNATVFRYRVEVEPMGWFGDADNPTDRFQKRFTFYTQ